MISASTGAVMPSTVEAGFDSFLGTLRTSPADRGRRQDCIRQQQVPEDYQPDIRNPSRRYAALYGGLGW